MKNKISLIKTDTMESNCPYCNESMVIETLKDNQIQCEVWKNIKGNIDRYAYDDGDSLLHNTEYACIDSNQYYLSFMNGKCRKCGEDYFSIFLDLCSKYHDTENGLMILEDITEYDSVELYKVMCDGKQIGSMTKYINGIVDDIKDNYYCFIIGALSEEIDVDDFIKDIVNGLIKEALG